MDKEEALIEFLNGLRVAINNSLAYSRQHPFFLRTSQDFKVKIDQALGFLDPVKVGVSPEALFLDGKPVEKFAFSLELAHILHQRKIESIEFKLGLTAEELADFLSLLSLQPKEIIRSGGLNGLLKKANVLHIHAEDLDYSGLLGAQGEDVKDIWLYLFKQTMETQDKQKALDFTGNFLKGVGSLGVKDIIEDDKLRDNLGVFFKYLKNSDKGKFSKCSQEFSGSILNSPSQLSDGDLAKLKEIFNNFDDNNLSDVLSVQLTSGKLNILNLGLFSRLAGKERADKISSSLANNADSQAALKNNPAALKKINDLLTGSDIENIPATYKSALIALIKDVSLEGNFSFDRSQLRSNYRTIILDLLVQSEAPDDLSLILKRLDNEWEDLAKERDFEFLKNLLIVLKQNKPKIERGISENIQKSISRIVEDSVWDANLSEALSYLVDNLEKISEPVDFYLNKIFEERKLSPYGVKLFLRFFPSQLELFYARLKEKHSDLEFLSQIIDIAGQIDLPVSLAVLKGIFSFGNDLIRLEVLKAMRVNKGFDPEFLFPLLKNENKILKKEAFGALLRDQASAQRAIDILLNIQSLFGLENQLIMENILVVEELNAREARDYLVILSKRRFFWNRQLRDKARQVLESWK